MLFRVLNKKWGFIWFLSHASSASVFLNFQDEYFVDDLVNLKVYYDNDEYVGLVKDVILMPKPTKDLLEIIDIIKWKSFQDEGSFLEGGIYN